MKTLVCFGTRPEAIKMAPVIFELRKRKVDFSVCVTAQHREMLDQVLDLFEIKPDHDLDLMQENQSLNQLSGRLLLGFEEVLQKERPEIVLVHGDTSTSVMIALAAFNRGIKVGHVEAGLRTYNKQAPFPEEMNRQLTARIADYHFAPTAKAKANLIKEQIPEENVFITGNTVVDVLQWVRERMSLVSLSKEMRPLEAQLDPTKKLILVTGHRRENFGGRLKNVCKSLLELSDREDVEVVFPVHLNPKVSGPVNELLGKKENIHLIKPVSYPEMLWLMERANLIISDSGGIQEEAPTFGKVVLVTRDFSERLEGVEAGFSILVGTDRKKIVLEAERVLGCPPDLKGVENPYGDGKAAERIVDLLLRKSMRS